MAELVENEIDWIIVFSDKERLHLWDLFTSKGFRHCFALRWDGFNWVLVDPLGSWLEVQVMPYGIDENVPQKMLDLGHKLLYVRKNRSFRIILRGPMTCVNIMKHLIGLRAFWIITPKQLYNYLKRKDYVKRSKSDFRRWNKSC